MDGWIGGLGSNACRDFCILTLQRAHTPERERMDPGRGAGSGGRGDRECKRAGDREPERAREGRGREEARQGEKELFVTDAIKHTRMSVLLSYRS